MSIELVLLFTLSTPPSASRLQAAFDAQHLPVKLSTTVDLTSHVGFLPLNYRSHDTGFEYSQIESAAFLDDYPEAKTLKPSNLANYAISLRWGGNLLECAAALDVGAAIVEELGAKAFDTESGQYTPANALRDGAKQCLSLAEDPTALRKLTAKEPREK